MDMKDGAWRRLERSGVILVSYRGPSMDPRHPAAGGLAGSLDEVARDVPTTWITAAEGPDGLSPRGARVQAVRIAAHERELFYGGFANRFFWMLAHDLSRGRCPAQIQHWYDEGYRPANERIARAVAQTLAAADTDAEHEPPVWVHDYHLFLVPGRLRALRPGARIGFFLHVPWPTLEGWQGCAGAPVTELVEGLLGADIVGLQTVRDAARLLAAIEVLVPGARVERHSSQVPEDTGDATVAVGTVHFGGRAIAVSAYPISIDVRTVAARASTPHAAHWRECLAVPAGVRTIVRVDRLDPAKNILLGFEAYEALLDRRSDLVGVTRFLAFLVPSRGSLPEYRDYRRRVLAKVEAINARFARPGAVVPVTLYQQNDVEAAFAGLSLADAVLINSRADGMNLVAKELTAVGGAPALVLSRLAGVAEAFGEAALLVDPDDVEGTALALAAALDMPAETRARRMRVMRDKVEAWTLDHWRDAQLRALARIQRPVPVAADEGEARVARLADLAAAGVAAQ